MIDIDANQPLYRRYVTLNKTYRQPLMFRFHEAGLYSQVNMLLNAATYALALQRQLAVDPGHFPGDWENYFGKRLPLRFAILPRLADLVSARYAPWKYKLFGDVLGWLNQQKDRQIELPDLGLCGDLFTIQRQLAFAFCPHVLPQAAFFKEPYISCHIRRGDKLIKEGEFVSVPAYMALARQLAPNIKHLHIISDDYAAVKEFKNIAVGYSISTICQPGDTGYVNESFSKQSLDFRIQATSKMIREVAIALRSNLFIGCYLSNPSRFVALAHAHPDCCFSVDSQKCWTASLQPRAAQ